MKKISKAERRLLLSSLGAIALLGGVAFWRASINATPQVSIPPYPIAPKPNGFDLYAQAAKMIVQANPAVDSINDPNPPTDEKTRAQKYSLQNKERWFKQNAAGFATFQKALQTPSLAPVFDAEEDSFAPYAKLRELARSKYIESSTRAMRGDWSGAMQSRLDTVQMGNDTARGGVLIAALVGFATQAIGRRDVENEIMQLDTKQARQTAKRMEEIYANRIFLVDTLRAEKTFGLLETLKTMRKPDWRDMNKWAEENLFGEKPTWKDRLQAATISKQAVVDNYVEIVDGLIASAKLSYAAKSAPIPPSNNLFSRNNIGEMNIRWTFARNDAANAMWMVALALHAYKLEHKSYPTTLRVLVGDYVKAIPADPFGGGEELRYKPVGESYSLWSIGPDMRDNGGVAIGHEKNDSPEQRKKPARVQPDSKGDYVWGRNQ